MESSRSSIPIHKCRKCSKLFATQELRVEHSQVCLPTYEDKNGEKVLIPMITNNSGAILFRCLCCSHTYTHPRSVKTHMKAVRFRFTSCQYVFKSAQNLTFLSSFVIDCVKDPRALCDQTTLWRYVFTTPMQFTSLFVFPSLTDYILVSVPLPSSKFAFNFLSATGLQLSPPNRINLFAVEGEHVLEERLPVSIVLIQCDLSCYHVRSIGCVLFYD